MLFQMFPIMMGMSNDFLNQNMKPIRLYRLLQSICNFDTDERVSTYNLAKVGRLKIFDFDYPLTDKIDKEQFEVNILNHFMNRRIGFETPTAFKISLNAKLNEIMPTYNKLFEALDGWDLLKDGEEITKTTTIDYDEKADYEKKNTGTDTMANTGTNTVANTGTDTNTQNGKIIDDNRSSDMPQSEIENVQDADYLTRYSLNDKTYSNLTNLETLNTQNQQTLNTQNQRTANLKETNDQNKTIDETITETENHTPSDKIKIYKEFLQNRTSIYTMIFDDLETCFYGLL